jgi:hypothetical protein
MGQDRCSKVAQRRPVGPGRYAYTSEWIRKDTVSGRSKALTGLVVRVVPENAWPDGAGGPARQM